MQAAALTLIASKLGGQALSWAGKMAEPTTHAYLISKVKDIENPFIKEIAQEGLDFTANFAEKKFHTKGHK